MHRQHIKNTKDISKVLKKNFLGQYEAVISIGSGSVDVGLSSLTVSYPFTYPLVIISVSLPPFAQRTYVHELYTQYLI